MIIVSWTALYDMAFRLFTSIDNVGPVWDMITPKIVRLFSSN